MEQYIYTNNVSLSHKMCKNIIQLFEAENAKHKGSTLGGVNTNIKDTTDYKLPLDKGTKWSRIIDLLNKELANNIKAYAFNVNKRIDIVEESSTEKYRLFPDGPLTYDTFLIQRYTKNEGRYTYHDDARIDWKETSYRVLTYIWYLNTVDEGGETEFWATHQVKPSVGKLVIFPATWSYPHRGKMPVSNDKYILTGWIYLKDSKM